MVFYYHSTLSPPAECPSVHFRIAVAEHFVFNLFSIFTSSLAGGLVEYFQVFKGTIAFVESDNLLSFPAGLHAFVAGIGFFSILQCSQFDLKIGYWAYHRSSEAEWVDEASCGVFPT